MQGKQDDSAIQHMTPSQIKKYKPSIMLRSGIQVHHSINSTFVLALWRKNTQCDDQLRILLTCTSNQNEIIL